MKIKTIKYSNDLSISCGGGSDGTDGSISNSNVVVRKIKDHPTN